MEGLMDGVLEVGLVGLVVGAIMGAIIVPIHLIREFRDKRNREKQQD